MELKDIANAFMPKILEGLHDPWKHHNDEHSSLVGGEIIYEYGFKMIEKKMELSITFRDGSLLFCIHHYSYARRNYSYRGLIEYVNPNFIKNTIDTINKYTREELAQPDPPKVPSHT